jgi:succinyl-CoA synthetase beta subunit
VHVAVPLVVRMQGTNVDIGKEILAESGGRSSLPRLWPGGGEIVSAVRAN